MAIKPGKRRSGGKKKAGPLTPEQVSKQFATWLGKMPPDCAAMISGCKVPSEINERSMRDEVASASAVMMHSTNYNPSTWQLPPFFEHTRMGRSIKWLQALPDDQRGAARDSAVEILKAAWPKFLAGLHNQDLRLHTIPDLWTPEEEFGPLDAPAPYLPSWRVDDEDAAVRAVAQASEEFAIYSLLVTWLNDQLGYALLDFDTYPF